RAFPAVFRCSGHLQGRRKRETFCSSARSEYRLVLVQRPTGARGQRVPSEIAGNLMTRCDCAGVCPILARSVRKGGIPPHPTARHSIPTIQLAFSPQSSRDETGIRTPFPNREVR